MELKRRELKLKLYGEDYVLSYPTVKMAQEFGKKLKEKGEEESMQLAFELLDKLGLPISVCEEMEIDHVMQVIDQIMPSKKK